MLDAAFDALKTYDWGSDRKVLDPIDHEVVASHGDSDRRAALEARLVAVLEQDVSRDAKDFVCRKLRVVGSDHAVPALADLLSSGDLSHMARYALERIPGKVAGNALREALPKLEDEQRIGVIGSLGVRQEAESVPVLSKWMADGSTDVAKSAAAAMGAIRSEDAAQALAAARAIDAGVRSTVTDASLACAEALLAHGKRVQALGIYKGLSKAENPKHVRLAATRGMIACTAKSGS